MAMTWCVELKTITRVHSPTTLEDGFFKAFLPMTTSVEQACQTRKWCHRRQGSFSHFHYIDVIMTTMVFQITSLMVVYSTIYSDADQRKHQSSASLAFVWGSHRAGEFPAQRASYAENVSIWWRHHVASLPQPVEICHGYTKSDPLDPWMNAQLRWNFAAPTATELCENKQVEGRSWIYVQHVNLRAVRRFTRFP